MSEETGGARAARRWALVRELFDRAMSLAPGERAEFLAAAAADPSLRSEVDALLKNATGEAFFDRPAGEGLIVNASRFEPGQRISHYEIESKIGEGGMGAVYRAIDLNLGRAVALKVMSRSNITSEDKKRFAREARSASALNHPNIVTIYEYGSDAGVDFIAMECVDGVPLNRLLAEARHDRTPMPIETILGYAKQVAAGLETAHAAGIVHRDLKPGNVIVTKGGVAKILDFGLAKIEAPIANDVSTVTALTIAGQVMGTPAYMAPEQAMGDTGDQRADIFSFGVMLYEMLAGTRPFAGADTPSTLRQILYKEPEPLIKHNPAVPAAIVALVADCLKKDREERLATMTDVIARLDSAAPKQGRRSHLPYLALAAVITGAGLYWSGTLRPGGEQSKSPREWFEIGQRYAERLDRQNAATGAIEAFQKAIEGDPKFAPAYAALGEIYSEQIRMTADRTRAGQALDAARKAVELDSYLAAGHSALGAALTNTGKVEEAIGELERARTLDARSARAASNLGLALERKGDIDAAEARLRESVALQPTSEIRHRLALFLQRRGRYADAAAELRELVRGTPDHAGAYVNLGGVLHLMGKDEEAAGAFQRSLEIAPSARGYTNLGTLLFYMGRYSESTGAFEKAVEMDATRYANWGNLADAYRLTPGSRAKSLEKYAEAIRIARKQLDASPKNGAIRSSLAAYLAKSDDKAGALREAAALDADALKNPSVLFKLVLVHEICGDRVKAVSYLEKALAAGHPVAEFDNEPEFVELRKSPKYRQILGKYIAKKKETQ